MVTQGEARTDGFCLVHQNDRFKCAFITRHEQYAPGKIRIMKRHLTSDEVFAPIRGRAVLVTADQELVAYERTQLEIGKSYCVPAGTWHYLAVTEDALVFVTENCDVTADNTEASCVEDQNLTVEV